MKLPPNTLFLFLILILILIPPCYPHASSATATLHTSSPPAVNVIPAFPEQANLEACPLNLSDDHYQAIQTACSPSPKHAFDDLHRTRCCPVLAASLYSAYSATALAVAGAPHHTTSSYDMPLLPDDSETCVSDLGKALKLRGIELMQPNETCDVVYCYCGIRLHPFTCPHSFSITLSGDLVGDQTVNMLEKDCLTTNALAGCSNCLHTLYSLKKNKASNSSKPENRTTKIHNKDCELMGLTWLLAKNQSAYIHTVSRVLRALMLSADGSDPQSCTLNSDGKPLAVDSSEMSDHSSSTNLHSPTFISLLFLSFLLAMHFTVLLVSP